MPESFCSTVGRCITESGRYEGISERCRPGPEVAPSESMRPTLMSETVATLETHTTMLRLAQVKTGVHDDHNSIAQYISAPNRKARPVKKKPACETTYFELLVLAFRVFEFQRSKVENSEEVRSLRSIKCFAPNVWVWL